MARRADRWFGRADVRFIRRYVKSALLIRARSLAAFEKSSATAAGAP